MRKVLFVLGELNDGDVDWLISVGTRVALTRGDVLIREKHASDALYIVLDGQLGVSVGASSAQRDLARIGSGEIVGELSFLDSRPPSATVTAIEPSAVLSVPRDTLAGKLRQDLGFASRFYRALGILLAYRMRNTLGYSQGAALTEDVTYDDELDPDLLDSVARAGARFDWMLKRVNGA